MSPSHVKRASILDVFSNSCLRSLFAALHEQRGQLPGMFILCICAYQGLDDRMEMNSYAALDSLALLSRI